MDNNYVNYSLGAGIGYLSYRGVKTVGRQIRRPYYDNVINQLQNFTPEENAILKQAMYDGFKVSGLGLRPNRYYLYDVNPENADQMLKLMNRKIQGYKFIKKLKKIQNNKRPFTPQEREELSKNLTELLNQKEYKKFWQEFKNACKGKPIDLNSPEEQKSVKYRKLFEHNKKLTEKMQEVANGKNAFCSFITRNIMINADRLAGLSFHEMGHALNASGNKLIRALVISSHVTKLFVPAILAVGLLTPKKKEGEESSGIVDKTATFIKNNVGKLTFAALIPTLAEEGLASVRGGQIAKKVLDPKLLKRVSRNNFLAWTTYFTGTLIATEAVYIAVKIRDHVVNVNKS